MGQVSGQTYQHPSVLHRNGRQRPDAESDAEGTDASAIEAIEPKLLKVGPVSLAPSTEEGKSSGLTFHYSPYAVGSYAEGEYIAFVPWETLKPHLTPEGISKDDDRQQ